MSKATKERQNLIEAVNTLPDEVLIELASFVEYLRYKTLQPNNSQPPKQNFLLTVAGLGKSGQPDISDSDEEILRNEIDPTYGWSSRSERLFSNTPQTLRLFRDTPLKPITQTS